MNYSIPDEFYFRLHHIRPRFKSDVENVLIYMATQISRLSSSESKEFNNQLNNIIKLYPENSSKDIKTINNWRTEISSLFGLVEYEYEISKPGRMAILLSENQDLIEFFRYFLYYFQYPGGHLKPYETAIFIKAGIKFKPAKYLIDVIFEGQKLLNGKFGITKAEATHCIFNDLRVTRDGRSANETAQLILKNREEHLNYDQSGDVIRYAGDILDYMELADLVKFKPNYQYYLNTANLNTLQGFINSNKYFEPYEKFYGLEEVDVSEISKLQDKWFSYVNNELDSSIFEADIISLIEDIKETTESTETSIFINEVLSRIRSIQELEQKVKTKEIGDVGETIIIEHEKARIKLLNREDLIHLIKKIPEIFAAGYDIQSAEENGNKRYIEVKTSISRGKLASQSFHLTPNEWSSASTLGECYYVYRLMISSKDLSLFLIQNPVAKYKESLLDMIPRDGATITYSEKSGRWEKLLV